MAVDLSTIVTIFFGCLSISVGIYAIWGGRGLIKAIGGIREDTGEIKLNIDQRMGDLLDIVRQLISRSGGTIVHRLKNIGTIKISLEDVSSLETFYQLSTETALFKQGFLKKLASETKEFVKLEQNLFGKAIRILVYRSTVMRLRLPSTDNEKCNKFVAFYLNWLDSVYWGAIQDINARETSLGEYLDD